MPRFGSCQQCDWVVSIVGDDQELIDAAIAEHVADRHAPESVLDEALRIIHGPRQEAYGNILKSFSAIGRLWSEVLGVEVSAEQVDLCMILLQVHRAANGLRQGAVQRDSIVDVAGYAGCMDKLIQERGGWQA